MDDLLSFEFFHPIKKILALVNQFGGGRGGSGAVVSVLMCLRSCVRSPLLSLSSCFDWKSVIILDRWPNLIVTVTRPNWYQSFRSVAKNHSSVFKINIFCVGMQPCMCQSIVDAKIITQFCSVVANRLLWRPIRWRCMSVTTNHYICGRKR